MTASPKNALVLAGSRGPTDPVAKAKGLPHKALVPVDGIPMLERVVTTLFASPGIDHVILCTDKALAQHGLGPMLSREIDEGRITLAEPKSTPSESVAHVLQRQPAGFTFPLLVTTADHPLLTVPMITHLCETAPEEADFLVGLAEAELIRHHYPDAIRTFYRFKGKGYSGCNLFLINGPRAKRIIDFWQEMERYRKRPWRLVSAVGIFALLRFVLGQLSLESAFGHLSKRVSADIRMVALPFAEAAIDVDKPSDLDLAETILRARG